MSKASIIMEPTIQNMDVPICKNCIHFSPKVLNGSFTSHFTRCNKFGNKDLVSGKINHEFATSCRNDETLCGKNGKYFIEDKYTKLKVFKYNTIQHIPKGIILASIVYIAYNITWVSKLM